MHEATSMIVAPTMAAITEMSKVLPEDEFETECESCAVVGTGTSGEEGPPEGKSENSNVGVEDGKSDGDREGYVDGIPDGTREGPSLGKNEGAVDATNDGVALGNVVGTGVADETGAVRPLCVSMVITVSNNGLDCKCDRNWGSPPDHFVKPVSTIVSTSSNQSK
jgi:hypothetical protein